MGRRVVVRAIPRRARDATAPITEWATSPVPDDFDRPGDDAAGPVEAVRDRNDRAERGDRGSRSDRRDRAIGVIEVFTSPKPSERSERST